MAGLYIGAVYGMVASELRRAEPVPTDHAQNARGALTDGACPPAERGLAADGGDASR